MSNTAIQLKKSGATGNTPSGLAYGEVALNYADGKIFYKTSTNTIDLFPSATATATLTNKTLDSPTLTGTPVAPTAAANTSNTQVATTAYADASALAKAVAMAIALG